VAELLNSSPMVFPVLECIHIFGFILLAGSIALLPGESPTELSRDMLPWNLAGLGLALTSGALLFASDPDHYYLNPAFQFKMAILLVALGFDHTIHKKTLRAATFSGASTGAISGSGKLVACLSLTLWALVIGGGIFIGFVNGPE
jgi:hypothetical protein